MKSNLNNYGSFCEMKEEDLQIVNGGGVISYFVFRKIGSFIGKNIFKKWKWKFRW